VTFFDRSAGGLPSVGSEIQWHAAHTNTRRVPLVEDVRRLDDSSSEPHSGQTVGRSMHLVSASVATDMNQAELAGRRVGEVR